MSLVTQEHRRTLKVWFGILIGAGGAATLAYLIGIVDTLPSISDLLLIGGSFLVGWVVATKLDRQRT